MSLRILVIGGTQFVGRHFVEAARAAGHQVTLFHRGKTGKGLFPGLEEVFGDRERNLGCLGRRFDWVVDTCGYVPRVVRIATEALAKRTERFLFISTVSVYGDFSIPGLDESAAVATIDDPETETVDGRTYGALKALCEDVVLEAFGDRALIPRPGIIAGPFDPTDRFTWYVDQAAQENPAPVPAAGEQPLQLIDARDLANWLVHAMQSERSGIYNTAGPSSTYGAMRAACHAAAHSEDRARAFAPDTCETSELVRWPLVVPPGSPDGLFRVDSSKARAAGLKHRPLEETAADTLAWLRSRKDAPPFKVGPPPELAARYV
ncbi:MAG: NAD-dependent epimerase/dehydratase family protein [Planctomycetota bacterium]